MPDVPSSPTADGPHTDLLARAKRLVESATPGPWGWRGNTDGLIELRGDGPFGAFDGRVVSTLPAEPCVVPLPDDGTVLTAWACASCKEKWAEMEAQGSTDMWESYRCPKPENLATLWLTRRGVGIEPANGWAVREVTYRTDVVRVDHPDAELIAAAPELIAGLTAFLRYQIAETKRLRERMAPVDLDALDRMMDQRDRAEEMADKLAAALAPLEVLGEHSNANDPWQNALDYAAEARAAAPEPERMTYSEFLARYLPSAAPEPLWTGETLVLPEGDHHSKVIVAGPVDVPPGTPVVILRADQVPAGVLEQVGWLDKTDSHEAWRHVDKGEPSAYQFSDWQPVYRVSLPTKGDADAP